MIELVLLVMAEFSPLLLTPECVFIRQVCLYSMVLFKPANLMPGF